MSKVIRKKYTQKEIAEFKVMFEELDTDKSGSLSQEEFNKFLEDIELPVEFSPLLFFIMDKHNGNEVSFDDFVSFMAMIDKMEEDPLYLFKKIFLKIDKDHSKKLDKSEVAEFMKLFPSDFGEIDIDEAFKAMDKNGDGLIGFSELMHALGH